MNDREERLAEAVRAACLSVAREAYEDAGLRGLCAEGRWEAAAGAIASFDLSTAIRPGDVAPGAASGPRP